MSNKFVIGLDIGTTSVKAVAFNKEGQVLSEVEENLRLKTKKKGWAEQDPLEIENATITAIRNAITKGRLNPNLLEIIGISSAMHSIICVDMDGNPLSPAIIWADGRAAEQAKLLKKDKSNVWYKETGTPIHPMTPFVKLLWMKENKYEPYVKASKFLSIKEFLLSRWFGLSIVDYSIASSSGMFNIHTFSWHKRALDLLGVSEEKLSTPVSPTTVLEGLHKSVANQLGILPSTKFAIGSSDGHLANLGTSAIGEGELAVTIGTSGAIRQMAPSPSINRDEKTFCYPFNESLFLIGGATNNGAIVMQWLKDFLSYEESMDSFIEMAKDVQPGAEGVLFLPFINGERAPLWNSEVSGEFYGLSISHKREHLVRACLEGIIYNIYHIGLALEEMRGPARKIVASGGFAKSELWLQILADVFNKEVVVPISHQSSAWGAAWLALYSVGEVANLMDIKQHTPIKKVILPKMESHERYMEVFRAFKKLSERLLE
ncbi:gluconokinase [Bacillus kwashiorkori]|uniref:gluconokinase n=1 Tax=Bacillus kwashiorkori TaxID=1522318 RepID=UPI0007828A21|nr:gluconokinase [Bacillus kwashiorkori]